MIWNAIPDEECLRLWKNLRDSLKELSLEDQLKEVAKFCASIPFGSRTLDYYDPTDWPTPWEILFHGSFCTSSISLLMYYTFVLTAIDANVELHLVEDDDGVFLLPIINDQFVLNYELGMVSMYPEIKNNLKVLKIYRKEQIKTIT